MIQVLNFQTWSNVHLLYKRTCIYTGFFESRYSKASINLTLEQFGGLVLFCAFVCLGFVVVWVFRFACLVLVLFF